MPRPLPTDRERRHLRPDKRRWRRWRLVLGVALVLAAALAFGAWSHMTQYRRRLRRRAAARLRADRARRRRCGRAAILMSSACPATTSAFAAANIFARASGYIDKRNVDIGDHVKAGPTAGRRSWRRSSITRSPRPRRRWPSSRRRCSRRKANRELAQVTWDRDRPLVEQGLGDRRSRAPSTSRR